MHAQNPASDCLQLVANGIIEDVFSLCFGYPQGGTMLLGECLQLWHLAHTQPNVPKNTSPYVVSLICRLAGDGAC